MSLVDFHNHTQFSVDALGTPEMTLQTAKELNLAAVSITEHNSIGSTKLATAAAKNQGVRYIPGLELDLRWGTNGNSGHFLCFWYDPDHQGLNDLVRYSNHIYDQQFELLVKDMEEAGEDPCLSELDNYLQQTAPENPQPSLWRMSSFWIEQGIVADKEQGWQKLTDLRKTAVTGIFPMIDNVLPIIRDAGGILLGAHPGPRNTAEEKLRHLLDHHLIDGFEIYHLNNGLDLSPLLALREEYDCAMSGGSDCHLVTTGSTFGQKPEVPDDVLTTMENTYQKLYSKAPPS